MVVLQCGCSVVKVHKTAVDTLGASTSMFTYKSVCDHKKLAPAPNHEKFMVQLELTLDMFVCCLLYTSPSPRDATLSRMPSSA